MFSTHSDPYLVAALWVGVVAVCVTLAMSVAIIAMRLRLRHTDRRWQRFLARWRPPLLAATLAPSTGEPLPRLGADEHLLFLRLWGYLHESIRGDAAERLNEVAVRLGIDATARRLLVSGSRAERLQAILAAGYLRDADAWAPLTQLASHPDGLVSVNAARALVRINPIRSARGLMPLIVRRHDWDLARVAAFLGEARQAFWVIMSKAMPSLQPDEATRALRLAEALRLRLPDPTLLWLLQPTQPIEVLRAALPLCSSPTLGPAVRACLAHEDDIVRAGAVRQMALLAQADDLPALTALLRDPVWAVRMATAQTLSRLPFVTTQDLLALQLRHPEANTALRQMVAEREQSA